jgi:hypothetical protein
MKFVSTHTALKKKDTTMKQIARLVLGAALAAPLMAATPAEREAAQALIASGFPAMDHVVMDTQNRSFCVSGTIFSGQYIDITFVLTEECCNWEINSCPSDETDTYFTSLVGPGVNYSGVDDPPYCPRDCAPFAPDVMNAGNAYTADGTPVRTCLPAGTYVLTLFSFSSFDPATCQPVDPGHYTVCINCNGGGQVDANDQAESFALAQNMPNPFNPSTSISFNLQETGQASLKVFDMQGREVATLVNGLVERGAHQVSFDASGLSSGMYVYTLQAEGISTSRKMVLMK